MSQITCPRIHVIGMRSLYKGMPFQLTVARIFESVLIDMKRFLSRHGLSINQSFAKQEIFWSFSYEPNDEGFWYLSFHNMTGLTSSHCAKKFRVKMMTEDKHQGKGSWGAGKSPKGGRGGDEKISKGSRGGDELSEGKSRGGDEESFTQSPGETIINPQYLIILGYFSPAVAFCCGCYDHLFSIEYWVELSLLQIEWLKRRVWTNKRRCRRKVFWKRHKSTTRGKGSTLPPEKMQAVR